MNTSRLTRLFVNERKRTYKRTQFMNREFMNVSELRTLVPSLLKKAEPYFSTGPVPDRYRYRTGTGTERVELSSNRENPSIVHVQGE